MAGVAPQRGGSNATTIGMVVSIVVAVLLLGVLIWLVTMQERLRNDANSAVAAKTKLVRGGDESAARRMFPGASGNKTLVGEMNKGVKMLTGRLSGNQEDSPTVAATKMDAALTELLDKKAVTDRDKLSAAHGAVGIIRNLHDMFASEKSLRQQAENAREKAETALEGALAANKQYKASFDGELDKLNARVDELAKAKSDFQERSSGDLAALNRKVSDTRDELSSAQLAHNNRMRQVGDTMREQNAMLESQRVALADLKAPAAALDTHPLAVARKPVGKVLDSLPANALVYVDLGARDNVALGMTFSVYSGDERVSESGRGKASIEVVNVGDRTSECRVVSPPSPDDPILKGDGVGNLVLSRIRAKKQRFCVVGEFDVDFDGIADIRGREKVKSLIERWGGIVVEEVDPRTDYVVIGIKPPSEDFTAMAISAENEEVEDIDIDIDIDEFADDEVDDEEVDDEEDDYEEEDDEDYEDEDEDDGDDDEDDGDDEDEDGDEDEDDEDADDEDEDEDGDDDEDDDAGDGGPGDDQTPGAVLIERKPEVDPTAGTEDRRERTEMQKYRDALRRARMFSIPILTQDQFFNFIGVEGTKSDTRRLQG